MEQGAPSPRAADRAASRRQTRASASQPATSATARAWRSAQGAGSRERRRAAASTRPGTVIDSMVQAGDGPGVRPPGRPDVRAIEARRGRQRRRCPVRRSRRRGRPRLSATDGPPGSGMPQRYAAATGFAGIAPGLPATTARPRPPSACALAKAPSRVTTTVPSVSVRNTSALCARRRSIVAGAGWPYGLPAPAETAAMLGRTASRNAPVDDVRLP